MKSNAKRKVVMPGFEGMSIEEILSHITSTGIIGTCLVDWIPVTDTVAGSNIITLRKSSFKDSLTESRIIRKGDDNIFGVDLEDLAGNHRVAFGFRTNWYGISGNWLIYAQSGFRTGIGTFQDRDLRIGIFDSSGNPVNAIQHGPLGTKIFASNTAANKILKINGSDYLVATSITDDGTTVYTALPLKGGRIIAGTDLDGNYKLVADGISLLAGNVNLMEVLNRKIEFGAGLASIHLEDTGNSRSLLFGKAETHRFTDNNGTEKFRITLAGAYHAGSKLATETYVDGKVVNLLSRQPAYDPTITEQYPTAADCHNPAGGIKAGFAFFVSAHGFIYSESTIELFPGDCFVAKVDNPGQADADWDILDANINYVPEDTANKRSDLSSPDNNTYPTTQAVQTGLDGKMGLQIAVKIVHDQNYTLELEDANILIEANNTTDDEQNIIVPLNEDVELPIGTVIDIVRQGTASLNIVPYSGDVTINTQNNLRLSGRFAHGQLVKVAEQEWYFFQTPISSELTLCLTQAATDPPTIGTPFCNTTSSNFTNSDFSRIDTGEYQLNKGNGIFANFRTQSGVIDAKNDYYWRATKVNDDNIKIETYSKAVVSGVLTTFNEDELLFETPIKLII